MSKKLAVALVVVTTVLAHLPSQADADGPLRRWWRSLRGRNCCPQTTLAQAPNAYNLQPGQCMKTCQQTCTRTVVNYVPQTAYRTCYKRVPVTQYRPVTTSDPCTGCTVTCMRPCTTYTYQCQRVPYTTYRPVYRTETYRVPVTTITNDCATGACATGMCATGSCATGACGVPSGCDTCATGMVPSGVPTPATSSQTYYETPGGSAVPTPADQTPSINGAVTNPQTSQRPVMPPAGTGYNASYPAPTPVYQQLNQPAVIRLDDQTAQNPIRERWSYSPVRLASHQSMDEAVKMAPLPAAPAPKSRFVEVN